MEFKGMQKSSLIDYPGEISTVCFTGWCNFRCPYCHNGHLLRGQGETITEADVLSFVARRKRAIGAVVISGGEPTMYGQELIEFIKKLKELGLRVKLDTNGTNPLLLNQIINDGLVDYIAMDIKAPLEKYYAVVKTRVNIEDIQKSIQLIKGASIGKEFRTTVCKELLTKEDIEKIIEMISPSPYYLQNFVDGETVLAGRGTLTPVDFLESLSNRNVKAR